MISFFRKIRQKLLRDNRFTKYLLYAIGEILLIVVGILIALQISNWNEKRKVEIKAQQLIEEIEEELIANLKEDTRIINRIYRMDSLTNLVLENKVTKEMYLNKEISIETEWYHISDILNVSLDKLLDIEDQLNEDHQPLLNLLKLYKRINLAEEKRIAFNMEFAKDEPINNSSNFPWWSHYWENYFKQGERVNLTDEAFQYLTGSIYRNKVVLYRLLYVDDYQSPILIPRRNLGLYILGYIKKEQENYEVNQLDSLYKQLGFTPIKEVGCGYDFSDYKAHNYVVGPLIWNLGDETVALHGLDENGEPNNLNGEIKPYKYWTAAYYEQGFDWMKGDSCIQRYIHGKHTYLLLE